MENEHDTEGDHFRQLEGLSNNFEIPDWGCNTYAVTMNLLKEFQEDLHHHIHLENNILFPKAIRLEQSLN
jgi:regulator of cell morphogenesis and NO signaling